MKVRRVRIRSAILAGTALLATVSLAAVPALAASNLVTNPSGVGGKVTGWVAPSGWGPLTGVQVHGTWWFHWVSDNVQSHAPGPGSAWYSYTMANLSPGQTISCGFKAMGSGTIAEDIWTGNNGGDHLTAPVPLSSTPKVFTETEKVGAKPWPGPPQVQVRYQNQTGNLNIYFTDVTCVLGSSVTLVADTTAAAATAGGGRTTATTTKATKPAASLPKTGGGILPLIGGWVAVAGGLRLLPRRRGRR